MGYEIPSLGAGDAKPKVYSLARVARELPPDDELVRIGKSTLCEIASEGEDERARVAAAHQLIVHARADIALSGPGKARTAAEMLAAVRAAIPELERRAAAEAGQLPPVKEEGGDW